MSLFTKSDRGFSIITLLLEYGTIFHLAFFGTQRSVGNPMDISEFHALIVLNVIGTETI